MIGLSGACTDNCPWTLSLVVLHDREGPRTGLAFHLLKHLSENHSKSLLLELSYKLYPLLLFVLIHVYHSIFFLLFFLLGSNDRSGGELSTIAVAAAIAGPMCVICALIMLFICWHQKRQVRKQEQFNEAEAALQPLEEEAVIPSGQTLKELMDMSTGRNSNTACF